MSSGDIFSSSQDAGGELFAFFCSETSLLIPLGTIYFVLFVCFVLHHLKWLSKEKVYMMTCP